MKKVTCYVPFNGYNTYSENIKKIIEANGYEVYPIKTILKNPILLLKCKLFNFNWFEDVKNGKEYHLKLSLLFILKLFGKKILFTLHNKHTHEENSKNYNRKMMKKMCISSDAIIGLCNETVKVVQDICPSALEKLEIISHPNYISNYNTCQQNDLRKELGIPDSDLVFLFMGVVSEYKNVEMLIDIFEQNNRKDACFLIAGNPTNHEYGEYLKKRLEGIRNIHYIFKHIPEEEIPTLYSTCDVVILPYKKSSYLNSGAVYLSFSQKKTVICPEIGTINDLNDKTFVYNYDYPNEECHKDILSKIIDKVINDYKNDRSVTKKKGEAAYAYVETVHSNANIQNKYNMIYRKLLGE
ncbi:MAG: glycosyltransferase family 4 protein [Lachnospiraceae bacterium]|nr:glycosyltransferase family 4 protein [Lachnospiraceae bacterium]